ncbi:class I SAM-dependent methyltransferase [Nocardioides caldifontis]|uniref:class I SAM-dependent methyltransferase n=1 Tax=Nocardioides caldifontis TaxID=2588938 RepID=UPI0011E0594F|nr:methyltransferase domain-containing protein [Nocardioides caldifontis]
MEPPTYTHGHDEAVLRSHRWRTAENSAAYLLPHLRPGQRLLDVGSGPGTLTADLAERVAPGPVTAVEIDEAAAALTRQGLAERGVEGEVRVADAHALPFEDGSFDVVHAHQTLQHVADPVRVLRELRRVCAPGGVVAARDSDYPAFAWFPEVPELDEWLALYLRVARSDGGEPSAGRRLRSWALEAGFTDVAGSSTTWCFASADEVAWWGGLWADRVQGTRVGARAVELGLTDRDGLRRIADGWRRWAAAPDAWFSSLHGEVLCRG